MDLRSGRRRATGSQRLDPEEKQPCQMPRHGAACFGAARASSLHRASPRVALHPEPARGRLLPGSSGLLDGSSHCSPSAAKASAPSNALAFPLLWPLPAARARKFPETNTDTRIQNHAFQSRNLCFQSKAERQHPGRPHGPGAATKKPGRALTPGSDSRKQCLQRVPRRQARRRKVGRQARDFSAHCVNSGADRATQKRPQTV